MAGIKIKLKSKYERKDKQEIIGRVLENLKEIANYNGELPERKTSMERKFIWVKERSSSVHETGDTFYKITSGVTMSNPFSPLLSEILTKKIEQNMEKEQKLLLF